MSVLCESPNYGYQECNVGTGDKAILSITVADTGADCKRYDGNYEDYFGEDGIYGVSNNKLWVHNGCSSNFDVCVEGSCSLFFVLLEKKLLSGYSLRGSNTVIFIFAYFKWGSTLSLMFFP